LRETVFLYRTGKLGYTVVKRYQTLENKYNLGQRRKALQKFASKISSTTKLDAVGATLQQSAGTALEGASNAILVLRASVTDDEDLKKKLKPRSRDFAEKAVSAVKSTLHFLRDAIQRTPEVALLLLGVDPERLRGNGNRPRGSYGSTGANERQFFRNVLLYPPQTPVEAGARRRGEPELAGLPLAIRFSLIGLGWGLGLAYGVRLGLNLFSSPDLPRMALRAVA